MTEKEYMANYYQAHKDRIKAQITAWKAANPEKVSEYNHKQYLRRKALKNGSGGVSGGETKKEGDTA